MADAAIGADEGVARVGPLRRLLVKPELGSLIGAVVVFIFFASLSDVFRSAQGIANWLDPASTLGIMAVAVALLMIGGPFDLSARVPTRTAGLPRGLPTTHYGPATPPAFAPSLGICPALRLLHREPAVRTPLP